MARDGLRGLLNEARKSGEITSSDHDADKADAQRGPQRP